MIGGAERDRTAGLLVANEALSQLSYSPTKDSLILAAEGVCAKRRRGGATRAYRVAEHGIPLFSTIEGVATPLANPLRDAEAIGLRPGAGGLLRFWHLASLDAPTVAVVWAWAFAWAAHIRLTAWSVMLLGLVVWAVYVLDRLLDARSGRDLKERHRFHWRNRRVLLPLAIAAALAAAAIVQRRIPALALPQDSAVALATLAYFSGVHGRLRVPGVMRRLMASAGWREWFVGALFAAGCLLPAWSVDPVAGPASPLRALVLSAIYFAALAWLNLRAISCWESGTLRLGKVPWVMAGIGVVLGAGLAPVLPRAAWLVAAGAVSALLIGWLDQRREGLEPVTLRASVDLVLLAPVLLVVAR